MLFYQRRIAISNILKQLKWLPDPIVLTVEELARERLFYSYDYANVRSPDPSTKNGSMIISSIGETVAYGVNKFPNGVAETKSRLTDKATKYRLVIHAENGAIFNAARHGQKTKGATLYCPFYACSECAKAIIQCGIVRVVGHAQLMAKAGEHTVWVQSIIDAWNVLHEAGVQCDLYNGEVGIMTRFNGQDLWV